MVLTDLRVKPHVFGNDSVGFTQYNFGLMFEAKVIDDKLREMFRLLKRTFILKFLTPYFTVVGLILASIVGYEQLTFNFFSVMYTGSQRSFLIRLKTCITK